MDLKKNWAWVVVFGLFLFMNTVYLHRVPGLLGDEGSEGENVYELLQRDSVTVVGERSYIGPWIDYLRVPFIAVFGYTTLAMRLPMLLFSIATFFLAASVLRRLFDDHVALLALVFLFFSPAYISYQRLGWAITLFPFFVWLIVWLVLRKGKDSALLTGLAAGVGLSTHIMFFPTLVALSSIGVLAGIKKGGREIVRFWPAVVGFVAGFGMQFVVLSLLREDQGDVSEATALFTDRVQDLPTLLPLLISGSSYVAAYTGVEFSPVLIWALTICIVVLAVAAFSVPQKKMAVLLLWIGLIVQVLALSYMIDRYTLRYFLVPVVWLWMLAGIGLAALLRWLPDKVSALGAVGVSVLLSVWMIVSLFVAFLQTGGSTQQFSLGNRVDNAAAHVDIQPLIACMADKGSVFSESVHIWNRLQYLSHTDTRLSVASEDDKKSAKYLISYIFPQDQQRPRNGELCPDLVYFRVVAQ